MRRTTVLLCLVACAAACATDLSKRAALSAADFPPDTDWMERARASSAQSDWLATSFFLDEWAAAHPLERSEEFWELRLRLAEGTKDSDGAEAVRIELLAILTEVHEDPEDQLRVWRRASALHEEAGRFKEAAEFLERAAAHPAAGARASAWWERASWMWERAGDRAAATRAIALALAGVELDEHEQAALSRLQAFQLGEIASAADAQTLLRFDANPEVRLRAAGFLASARFEDDVAAFTRALSDPDPRILQLCLRQLAERAEAGEFAYVAAHALPFVSHADLELRIAALDALAITGSRGQVPTLLSALQPEDRAGFRAARRALEAVTGHAEPATLDPDLEGRRRLREAWLAWWKSQAET